MEKDEKANRVEIEYPEIRKILQRLYSSAYRSGQNPEQDGDCYDYSTAYEEIEKLLQK